MSEDERNATGRYRLAVGMLAITAALIWATYRFGGDFTLPIMALGGVLVLLAALLCFSTLMNVVGLSDKTQALGLPEGSVRAIIALALVGLFAILASSFLVPPPDEKLSIVGLSDEQVSTFRKGNPAVLNVVSLPEARPDTTKPQTYTLNYSLPGRSGDDFAKQTMTLVGTLMTAVVSFYFGAMPKQPGDTSRTAPELSGLGSLSPPKGSEPLKFTLTGSNLNNVRTVRLTKDSTAIEATSILSNPGQVICEFPPNAAFGTAGSWDVMVIDDSGRSSTKKNLLTLTAAGQTPPPSPPPVPPLAPPPAPAAITPLSATVGTATDFTITGSGLAGVKKVEAVPAGGGASVAATDLASTADQVTCKLALAAGTWSVQVTADHGPAVPVPGSIKV